MEPQPVEPKPVKVSVRLMPAVAGLHIVDLRAGHPHADMGINRTAVSFPKPWQDNGQPDGTLPLDGGAAPA